MLEAKLMRESEGFVRWRDDRLAEPTTSPGVPIDFAGHRYQVCITDDGRPFILLPYIAPEPEAV